VTGDLGGALMGLQSLEREKQVYLANPTMQPELDGKSYVVLRQLKPEARKDLKELFVKLEYNSYICRPCPYGDGRAAEKIKKILDEEL